MTNIEAVIEPAVIRNYKRLTYKLWYAVAEMIDNSIQSARNNPEVAQANNGEPLEVRIVVDKNKKIFRISDNAFGMDLSTLKNALVHGQKPLIDTGLSEFGMGLKTSACWMGDLWTIRTTALGNSKEYTITYDVEEVAKGNLDLNLRESKVDPNTHHTVIEISKWNRAFSTATVTTTKEFLASMYRLEINSKPAKLRLTWDEKELKYAENLNYLQAANGMPYRKDLNFKVGKKKVTGWVAVIAPAGKGKKKGGGTTKAGFALARRGRLYKAQPDAWRPKHVFGGADTANQGANSVINQRLVGEIHLDDFAATQQKDDIAWEGDEEELLGKKLREECDDFRRAAIAAKVGDATISDIDFQHALAEVKTNFESSEFVNSFVVEDAPGPTEVEVSTAGILAAAKLNDPTLEIKIGHQEVEVFIDKSQSVNDPYVVLQTPPSGPVVVIINPIHPHMRRFTNPDALIGYIVHCTIDALAELKVSNQSGDLRPDVIRTTKDRLLRAEISSSELGLRS